MSPFTLTATIWAIGFLLTLAGVELLLRIATHPAILKRLGPTERFGLEILERGRQEIFWTALFMWPFVWLQIVYSLARKKK